MEKLNVKEKLHYLFKGFDEKLDKRKLSCLLKISYEGLNEEEEKGEKGLNYSLRPIIKEELLYLLKNLNEKKLDHIVKKKILFLRKNAQSKGLFISVIRNFCCVFWSYK